jgi:outer membrane lipoprotein-sorting protein
MKLLPSIFAATLSVAALPGALAQAPDAHLSAVLAQLDAASEHFTNARADFSQDYYEAVVKDTTTEVGSIYFQRSGKGTQMGAVTFNPQTKAKDKVFEFKDGLLRILDPSVDQIRVVKPTSGSGQIESFLTLGFGGSGKALAQSWNITDQGSEMLTDSGQSVKTEKLDLVSKDPGVRNTFTHVTIWVDPVRGVSLKQVFETASHDKRTSTYSHIKLNTKIDMGTFELKKGAHTTVVGP